MKCRIPIWNILLLISLAFTLISSNKLKIILQLSLLIIMIIYALFIKRDNNKKIISYLTTMCLYIILYSATCFISNKFLFIQEVKALILYMFFPLIVSAMLLIEGDSKHFEFKLFIYEIINILLIIIFKISKNSNLLSITNIIMIMLYPFIILRFIKAKEKKNKLIYFFIALIPIYITISTKNITNIIILFTVMILYILLSIFHSVKTKEKSINILLIMLLIVLTIIGYKVYNNNDSTQTLNVFEKNNKTHYNIAANNYNILNDFEKTTNSNQNIMEKVFGTSNENNKQKKYSNVPYLYVMQKYGILGLILYIIPFIYVLYHMVTYIIRNKISFINDYNLQTKYIHIIISVVLTFLLGKNIIIPSIAIIYAIVASNTISQITKINNNSKKIWTLKRIIQIIIATLLVLTLYFLIQNNKEIDGSINIIYNDSKIIINNKNLETKKIKEEIISSNYAKDVLEYYEIKKFGKTKSKIIIVNRYFNSGIIYTYITGKNISGSDLTITIENADTYDEYLDFKKYEKEKEYSTTIGFDKTSLPSKYFKSNNKYYLAYYTYTYNYLSIKYDKTNYSSIKELIDKSNMSETAEKKLGYKFDIKNNNYFDTLIISSNNEMFNSDNEINEFVGAYYNNKASAWLSFDGAYTKLPYSIEPYEKDGYGRNIGNQIEKGFTKKEMINNKNNLYKSFVDQSIHVLEEYIPRYENSVWLTEYTSTWLSSEYDIKSFYVDTRHNDTIANQFLIIANTTNDNHIKQMSEYYAKYLLDEYYNNNNIKTKYGILSPDYYSNNHPSKTHTSLNHQLAIINYLLRTYNFTYNEQYKKLALDYLETITNIGTDWIKDNYDLYYQMDSNCYFDGIDYTELTLDDLITTQELLLKVNIEKSETLDKLIYSKIKYLKSINHNISEGINQKLIKYGYIN